MKILVRGRDPEIVEFKSKFRSLEGVQFDLENSAKIQSGDFELIFDYFLDESPENLDQYRDINDLVVFCNSVKTSLAEFSFYLDHDFSFKMIGFNGMPTFINRDLLEIALLDDLDKQIAEKICSGLGTDFIIVQDSSFAGDNQPFLISRIQKAGESRSICKC